MVVVLRLVAGVGDVETGGWCWVVVVVRVKLVVLL